MKILQSRVDKPQEPRLILKGQFDSTTEYLVGDIVVYDNGVYAMHAEGQATPSDDMHWQLLTKAENGKDGQDGVSIKGEDGRSVELKREDNYIQWRHEDGEWNNIIDLAEFKGKDGRDGIDGKDGQAIVGDKGPKGDKGDDGKSINWRGIFSLNVKYQKLDAVEYRGSSYIATDSVSGRSPDKSNRWDLMAKKGEDGSNGSIVATTSGSTVSDEAYGATWDGSLEAASKNALYDKIETIGSGSGGASPYITDGLTGITTIRMESPTKLWDFTVDDTGAWVSTEVVGGAGGSPIGLLLTLTYYS